MIPTIVTFAVGILSGLLVAPHAPNTITVALSTFTPPEFVKAIVNNLPLLQQTEVVVDVTSNNLPSVCRVVWIPSKTTQSSDSVAFTPTDPELHNEVDTGFSNGWFTVLCMTISFFVLWSWLTRITLTDAAKSKQNVIAIRSQPSNARLMARQLRSMVRTSRKKVKPTARVFATMLALPERQALQKRVAELESRVRTVQELRQRDARASKAKLELALQTATNQSTTLALKLKDAKAIAQKLHANFNTLALQIDEDGKERETVENNATEVKENCERCQAVVQRCDSSINEALDKSLAVIRTYEIYEEELKNKVSDVEMHLGALQAEVDRLQVRNTKLRAQLDRACICKRRSASPSDDNDRKEDGAHDESGKSDDAGDSPHTDTPQQDHPNDVTGGDASTTGDDRGDCPSCDTASHNKDDSAGDLNIDKSCGIGDSKLAYAPDDPSPPPNAPKAPKSMRTSSDGGGMGESTRANPSGAPDAPPNAPTAPRGMRNSPRAGRGRRSNQQRGRGRGWGNSNRGSGGTIANRGQQPMKWDPTLNFVPSFQTQPQSWPISGQYRYLPQPQ